MKYVTAEWEPSHLIITELMPVQHWFPFRGDVLETKLLNAQCSILITFSRKARHATSHA